MIEVYSGGKKIKGDLHLDRFDAEAVGVFESLRTYKGKIFYKEEHIQRFLESLKTSGLDVILGSPSRVILSAAKNLEILRQKPPQDDTVKKIFIRELDSAMAAFYKEHPAFKKDDVFIRLTAWPYGGSPEDKNGGKIIVVITQRKHPPEIYKNGVVLRTSSVRRSLSHASPPQAKTTAYQNPLLATLDPSDGYEWVFLDQAGYVTEVRIGNLFIVKDGKIFTPPTTGILNGVTRRFVLECARTAKVPVQESPLTRHEIFNADEAFLTNTSWEILPVRELDGRKVGLKNNYKIPGPLTRKLQTIFKKKI